METYVGENPPKSKGVVWVHHDTYNDINSPLVLEVSKSGKYTEVQSAKTLKKIADVQAQLDGNASVISALLALVDNAGDHKAISYDAEEGFKVCGFRTVIYGAGVPSSTTIPRQWGIPAFVGQIYIDTTAASNGLYYATGTTAVSDWHNA